MDEKQAKPNPILEGLVERRTVVLGGEITSDSTGDVGQKMLALQMKSADPITLIIDSGGGNIDAALKLCDLMTTVMTAPVRGVALGACGSAATFVMLSCNERLAAPHSRFLIHSGSVSKISVQVDHSSSENIEQLLKHVKATEERILRFYMNHLTPAVWANGGMTDAEKRKYVQQLIKRGDQQFDDWMSAEEAIEAGLVTAIVRDKLDIF